MKKTVYVIALLTTLLPLFSFTLSQLEEDSVVVPFIGTWSQAEYLIDKNGDGIFENEIFPCQLNDHWDFTADQQFQITDVGEFCDPDVGQSVIFEGRWALQNNDTEILVSSEDSSEDFVFHICSHSENMLELRLYNVSAQSPSEERIILRR